MHFTDIDHLETIISDGLLCDLVARTGVLRREAGHPRIKADRRKRRVDIPPFGCVADYAPFYFAPCSPMMSAIFHGRVPEYGTDVTGLMYLVTTTQALVAAGLTVLVTDRNAKLKTAEFRPEAECDDLVDWDIMKVTYWGDTDEDPERSERRMAECLVHRRVPFEVFSEIVVHGVSEARIVREVLARNEKAISVVVRPGWYRYI
jgi:ssDNA thymidine ADP-ribosyltransferase, DarT